MSDNLLTAENALLGACLNDPTGGCFREVLSEVSDNDLASDVNRSILRAARELDAEGCTPDAPAVRERTQRKDADNDYFMRLMDNACATAAIGQNIEVVRRAARLRTLAQLCSSSLARVKRGDDPGDISGDMTQALDALNKGCGTTLINSASALQSFHDFRTKGRSVCVPTGILGLDKLLGGGLLESGLYILAARPAVGKTALALQIADTVARTGGGVLFATLEMDPVQLTARRIARLASISSARLLMGQLSDEEAQHVNVIEQVLSELPLYYNKKSGCTITDVRMLARQVRNLKLVVIDYLGLLRAENRTNSRYEEVTLISQHLKQMARDLCVPVFCLAQLNRASEQRFDKRPMLSDLRDSGAIEQDADGVLLLHRPDLYVEEQTTDDTVEVECRLARNRHGATGEVTLAFDRPTGAYMEIRRKNNE